MILMTQGHVEEVRTRLSGFYDSDGNLLFRDGLENEATIDTPWGSLLMDADQPMPGLVGKRCRVVVIIPEDQ